MKYTYDDDGDDDDDYDDAEVLKQRARVQRHLATVIYGERCAW